MHFTKITILGPGLLGGSVALGLRAREYSLPITLWTRNESTAEEINRLKLPLEVTSDFTKAVADAELLILCTPVEAMPKLLQEALAHLKQGCLITDVGSVKGQLVASLESIAQQSEKAVHFVGSHPMAGSEQTGIRFATPDLFKNAICIVTPTENSDPHAITQITDFWKLLGAKTRTLSPDQHDFAVARISHLPHLAAAALVNTNTEKNPTGLQICGNGFLDTTRVASGSPSLWLGIFKNNRKELIAAADELIKNLTEAKEMLETEDWDKIEALLSQAKTTRDNVLTTRSHGTI